MGPVEAVRQSCRQLRSEADQGKAGGHSRIGRDLVHYRPLGRREVVAKYTPLLHRTSLN